MCTSASIQFVTEEGKSQAPLLGTGGLISSQWLLGCWLLLGAGWVVGETLLLSIAVIVAETAAAVSLPPGSKMAFLDLQCSCFLL